MASCGRLLTGLYHALRKIKVKQGIAGVVKERFKVI
jgi:hypothetical protein